MAKKKSGSIAVPFLATIFIGLLILGGAVFFIYRHWFKKDDTPPAPKPRDVKIVSYEDNHTVLFILDEPEQKCNATFALMRSIPKDRSMLFLGIPSNTIAVIDDQQQSLKGAYERGGGASAAAFVSDIMGVDVDKYMIFDSESFKTTCDKLGCVTYPVDVEISGMKHDGTPQELNSEQMETFITYSLFPGGEADRAFRSAHMISYMVNGTEGTYIADNIDNFFNEIINTVESNITSVDYKDYKDAIKQLFSQKKQYGNTIAVSVQFEGTSADNDFIPSDTFIEQIRNQFFSQGE
ncbi:MAG: LCP family protein [Ruminococcus sp.]|nr:LCP family protein [Ruminococcus sp.]